MKPILALGLLLLPGLLAGSLMARRGAASPLERLGDALAFGPLIAMANASLLLFYTRFLGFGFPGASLQVFTSLVLVAAFLVGFLRRAPAAPRESPSAPKTLLLLPGSLALGALVSSSLLFWKRTAIRPDGGWDGVAIWNSLGRFLARFGGDMHTQLAAFQYGHPEYPHMLPGSLASVFRLAGSEASLLSQGLAYAIFLSFLFVLLRIGQRLAGLRAGLWIMAIAAATPHFVIRCADQYADTLVASLNAIAIGGFAIALRGDGKHSFSPWYCGFFLGLLPWAKNEGWVHALVLIGAFFVLLCFTKERRPAGLRALPRMAIGALPGFLAWVLFRSAWAPPERLSSVGVTALFKALGMGARWENASSAIFEQLSYVGGFDFSGVPLIENEATSLWVLFWPTIGLALGLAAWRRGLWRADFRGYLAIAAGLQFAAVMLLFVVIPLRQEWHLQTAMPRLLLQVTPGFLLLLACTLPDPAARSMKQPFPAQTDL